VRKVRDGLEHLDHAGLLPYEGGGTISFASQYGPADAHEVFKAADDLCRAIGRAVTPRSRSAHKPVRNCLAVSRSRQTGTLHHQVVGQAHPEMRSSVRELSLRRNQSPALPGNQLRGQAQCHVVQRDRGSELWPCWPTAVGAVFDGE
jgi:hypothetical protein